MSSNQSKAGTVGLGTGIPGYLHNHVFDLGKALSCADLHVVGASTVVSWHTAGCPRGDG